MGAGTEAPFWSVLNKQLLMTQFVLHVSFCEMYLLRDVLDRTAMSFSGRLLSFFRRVAEQARE